MDEVIFGYIVDYCSGHLGEADGKVLRAWIDASPENRKTFEEYLRLVKMQRMAEGGDVIRGGEAWVRLSATMRKRKVRRLRRRVLAVAAVVLLLAGVGTSVVWQQSENTEPAPVVQVLPGSTKAMLVLANGEQLDLTRGDLHEVEEQGALIKNDTTEGLHYESNVREMEKSVCHTIKVPVAGEYRFTLSDGTVVWMNSESEITFPVTFVGGRREVSVKGEVYFDVAKDAGRAFVVNAGSVVVEVLGTKFNIAAYEGSGKVVTTLVEGALKVASNGEMTELSPDEQLIVDLNSGETLKKQVMASIYTSWVYGIFEYENMPLEDICLQLSRWYNVNFIFSAPEFKMRCFTGVVKKYDVLNDVLKVMEKTTNVNFLIDRNTISIRYGDD